MLFSVLIAKLINWLSFIFFTTKSKVHSLLCGQQENLIIHVKFNRFPMSREILYLKKKAFCTISFSKTIGYRIFFYYWEMIFCMFPNNNYGYCSYYYCCYYYYIVLSTHYLLGMFHICVLAWCLYTKYAAEDWRKLWLTSPACFRACWSSLIKFCNSFPSIYPLPESIYTPNQWHNTDETAFISQPKSIFQNHLKRLTIYLLSNFDILTG